MDNMVSPIANLGPEILLKIFEWLSRDGNAALIPSALCCRKWRPLVLSVLYSDVVLTQQCLSKFVENCADHEIRSLTLRLAAIPVNPYDTSEARKTAESRLEALRRLCPRISRMRPAAVSIQAKFPFPFTAWQEISSILDHLPDRCVSLEIDVRYSSLIHNLTEDPPAYLHLCDSIRVVLPRLRHLRLRLPLICPAIFSAGLTGQAIHAPMLKTCLINLSLRPPGPLLSEGVWATPCTEDTSRIPHIGQPYQLPSALSSVLLALKDFARLNYTTLERLWVIDVVSREPAQPRTWAAWVRRDFISNNSFPIPVANIGGLRRDAWLARIPSPTSLGGTQDWLAPLDTLETLAEGSTWIETTSKARLPITMQREHQDVREALTRVSFQKRSGIHCMLWRNEDETGEKLLPEGPGELMRQWDLSETTPSGWTRDEHTTYLMTRV